MIVALMAAGGAPWESTALTALNGHPGVVVLKRCVDIDDLLASASAGQADVAVLGLDSPGLDAAAVDHLRKHGVRPVAVVASDLVEPGRVRGSRIGIRALVPDDELEALPEVVTAPDPTPTAIRPPAEPPAVPVPAPGSTGRVIVVWGPAGAPGRTTLAAAMAAELARRQRRTILVDADPYGGTVAQQLGIMDEVSGLLAAARLATSGALEARFASVQRGVDGWLSVVTGLPRPDRYAEVRAGTIEHLLEVARSQAHVVVDTGFSLEDEPGREYAARPGRNQLTLGAIDVADELVVVGSADPMGLSRLARALVDLRELTGGVPTPGRGQPDAADPGLVGEGHRRHGVRLRPLLGPALPARGPAGGRPRPDLGPDAGRDGRVRTHPGGGRPRRRPTLRTRRGCRGRPR